MMAAICARSKQLIPIILDKIEGASRLGVRRWFSFGYSRLSSVYILLWVKFKMAALDMETVEQVHDKQFFYNFR